jgi:hypothetical protein
MNDKMQEGREAPVTERDMAALNPEQQALVQNHGEKLEYLEGLRKSGVTNMFGAGEYLEAVFGIDVNEARKVLSAWMMHYEALSKFYGWR